ncbi:MAG: hypothetical protein KAJ53_02100 [Anaerolineales bacterium]|nr:hypothetical protein [Anaerolineales bacterium]
MDEDRAGSLMEYGKTDMLFTNHQEQVTEDYCFVQDESSFDTRVTTPLTKLKVFRPQPILT